jgi:hypothetical protein
LLVRSYTSHKKNVDIQKETEELKKAESQTIQGMIDESASNVAMVYKRSKRIYRNSLQGLMTQDLSVLKSTKKESKKLSAEIDVLRDNIYFYIKNLEDNQLGASRFYIDILGQLQDMTQSLDYISNATTTHINNNHKSLKFTQMKDLKEIIEKIEVVFKQTENIFNNKEYNQLRGAILEHKNILELVNEKIDRQVKRTKDEESSPKNTTLYFGLLTETNEIISKALKVISKYYVEYDEDLN